jgi:hypothetical protein
MTSAGRAPKAADGYNQMAVLERRAAVRWRDALCRVR